MFGLTGIRLGVAITIVIALASFVGWAFRVDHLRADWKAKWQSLNGEAVVVLAAAGRASNNPRLRWREVPDQIEEIAASRKAWKGTAELQSSRIDELANETARLKALNAEARARAQAAIAKRESAIKRLETAALTPGERADCAKQLFDAEAALDLAWREGL